MDELKNVEELNITVQVDEELPTQFVYPVYKPRYKPPPIKNKPRKNSIKNPSHPPKQHTDDIEIEYKTTEYQKFNNPPLNFPKISRKPPISPRLISVEDQLYTLQKSVNILDKRLKNLENICKNIAQTLNKFQK